MIVKMYTDGAAKGNPGPGGYGTILTYGEHEKELSAGFKRTTNNRMELLAVIAGLSEIKVPGITVEIYSDSRYVVDSISKGWVHNWARVGFKDKKNPDLWSKFLDLEKKFVIKMIWIRGHAGHVYNERCDRLAVRAAEKPQFCDIMYDAVC